MKYYKLINGMGWGGSLKQGTIYPGDYKTHSSNKTDVEYYATNGYAKDWEKSTKEAYNKQEGIVPKPRVKKVVEVDPHVFKVGDKVEFIGKGDSDYSTYYDDKTCKIGEIYTINYVDGDSIKLEEDYMKFWLNRKHFKLSAQTKLKQTKMENYSIEGSKALKTAFVEECGLKLNTSITISHYNYFTSEDKPVGTVQGCGGKKEQHFVLPKDWDAAVKYVTEFNTEPKFKNGDYVVVVKNTSSSCNKVGDVGVVSRLNRNSCNVTVVPTSRGYDNTHHLVDLRLATPAEIEKATKVIFKAGDIVVITGNSNYSENKVGDIGICVEEIEPHNNTIKVKGSGNNISSCWTKLDEMRMATATEIKVYKESPTFKMAGYYSTINKSAKTISFGCQTYTKKEVKLLLDASELCARVGYNAKVKGSGFVVNETDILTPANLTKILEQLK